MVQEQSGIAAAAAKAVAVFEHAWKNKEPEIVAVAPGRVCVIGEHIDYNGYSVVTAAIDRYCSCALACKRLAETATQKEDTGDAGSSVTVTRQTLEAGGTSATQGHLAAGFCISRDGEDSNTEEQQDMQMAEFDGFLAVRHSDHGRFAPLYVERVEVIFPTLQALLQQQQEQRHTSPLHTSDTAERKEWHPYILAGCLGALEFFVSHSSLSSGSITVDSWEEWARGVKAKLPRISMTAAVTGNLPLGAGLSSSSALVVSVASAISTALGCVATPKEMAEICTLAERYVGVQGGGMDQACICMARSGFASLTSFNPLRVEYLKLPDSCTLALGYCGADAMKIVDSDKKYNLRVLECTLAALLLMGAGPSLPGPLQALEHIDLSYVQSTFLGSLEDAAAAVESILHEEPYGKRELEAILGDLVKQLLKQLPALLGAWERNDSFKLRQRARHAFSEAMRVRQFADICKSDEPEEEKIRAIGELAKASHLSCKNDFECSSEKLDEFVSRALVHGAVGSRLTGAGWGGFTVSFLRKGDEEHFEKKESNLLPPPATNY